MRSAGMTPSRARAADLGDADRALAEIDDDAAAGRRQARDDAGRGRSSSPKTSSTTASRWSRTGTPRPSPMSPKTTARCWVGVEGRAVGEGARRAGLGGDRELGDALDQRLAPLAVGDEVGDRDAAEAVLGGEARDLGAALDRAVVVDEFGEHADRLAGRRAGRDRPPPRCGRSA